MIFFSFSRSLHFFPLSCPHSAQHPSFLSSLDLSLSSLMLSSLQQSLLSLAPFRHPTRGLTSPCVFRPKHRRVVGEEFFVRQRLVLLLPVLPRRTDGPSGGVLRPAAFPDLLLQTHLQLHQPHHHLHHHYRLHLHHLLRRHRLRRRPQCRREPVAPRS